MEDKYEKSVKTLHIAMCCVSKVNDRESRWNGQKASAKTSHERPRGGRNVDGSEEAMK